MREQTANALPTERREGDCRGGGGCCVGSTVGRVPKHQHSNTTFGAFGSARSRPSGPPEEVAKPREGVKGEFFIIVVVGDIDGNGVMLGWGSKGVVVTLMEPVLVNGLRDHAGWTLDRIRGDVEGLVVGRVFIGRFTKRVMKTTGQPGVVLLRPGGGEAGHADGERATGEIEPGGSKGRPKLLLLIAPTDGPEGISVDGLTFEIGFFRGERVVGDPRGGGSREGEPSDLGDG